MTTEYDDNKSGGTNTSEAVQVTNDLYNRVKFMEMAAFFFGFAGLGMVVIEYELRYFLEDGLFVEWIPEGGTPPDPAVGANDLKSARLQILLVINLLCTCMTGFAILSR